MMKKVMFDCNAFSYLIDRSKSVHDFFDKCQKKYQFYVTAIQIQELAQIKDKDIEKRVRNLLCLCQMRATLVSTVAVFGATRFGYCIFGDENDHTYENLLNDSRSNVNDALIGESAKREGCILITDDKKFIKKLKANQIPTMTFDDFYSSVTKEA